MVLSAGVACLALIGAKIGLRTAVLNRCEGGEGLTNVIVLFPKIEDAKNIRNLLVRHGFQVPAVCSTGAMALAHANDLSDGIVVCGYKYPDMLYSELKADLPPHFEMLLVASQRVVSEVERDIMCVTMPIKVQDLLNTLEMMSANIARRRKKRRSQPAARSEEDKQVLWEAKTLLMERNSMTEEEAHRYIQKCSMDSGTNLVETAQMVLSMMNFS